MFYGYPAELVAEWCCVAISTAYAYKTRRLKSSRPAAKLFRLSGHEPVRRIASGRTKVLTLIPIRRLLAIAIGLAVASCSPTFVVKEPAPSGLKLEVPDAQASGAVSVLDERSAGDPFTGGSVSFTLATNGAPLQPVPFLANSLTAELASRGVDARFSAGEHGAPRLHLKTFRIHDHEVTSYSPFVTLTLLSADVETASGSRHVAVFVKRGKVPILSLDEVVDTVFNDALSVAVKELATKYVAVAYGYRSSDRTVEEIARRLATRTPQSFMDVYELGFTNNPAAVPRIVELLNDPNEYVRLAAISSLGTLGASNQFARLKAIYDGGARMWQDRAMAIKSIGDLNTSESRALIEAEANRLAAATPSDDRDWTLEVLGLYR
jgi:hypothetical protein